MIKFLNDAFHKANRDWQGYRTEAYVVMQPDKYPKRSAKDVNIAEEFFNTHGVELFEKNEKEF